MIALVAIPLGLIASVLLALLVTLIPGVASAPWGGPALFLEVTAVAWIAFAAFWIVTSQSARHAARRGFMTLAVECFAMPVFGLLYGFGASLVASSAGQSAGSVVGALAAGGILALGLGCVGFILGALFLVIWLSLRKEPV